MDPKGYETKPWWPYVKNLQDQIAGGGSGGGGGDNIFVIPITKSDNWFTTYVKPDEIRGALTDGKELRLEFNLNILYQGDDVNVSIPISQFITTSGGPKLVGMITYQYAPNFANNNVEFLCANFYIEVARRVSIEVVSYKQTEIVTPVN